MRKYEEYNHLIACENCEWSSFVDYFPYCTLHNSDKGLLEVCDDFKKYKHGVFEIKIEN